MYSSVYASGVWERVPGWGDRAMKRCLQNTESMSWKTPIKRAAFTLFCVVWVTHLFVEAA